MDFNDRKYTIESIIKELILIENHAKDGSATDAGCGCIEGKHLFAVQGYSEEGILFAKSESEKKYYSWLADVARNQRRKIESADWCIPCNPAPNHKCGVCHSG